MKKYLFPILILLAMFLVSLMYYADVLDDFQLKASLAACTLLWFVGLFVGEKILNKSKA